MKPTCPYCKEASRDGLLCPRCTREAKRNLRRIVELWPTLQESVTRRDNLEPASEVRSKQIHGALPFRTDASAVADKVRSDMVMWARICVEDYSAPWPRNTIASVCQMLIGQASNLRRHPDAGGWAWDAAAAVRWITAAVDLTDRRAVAGPCPEATGDGEPCPGIVFAVYPVDDRESPHLDCSRNPAMPDAEVCGRSWPAKEFNRMGLRIAGRQAQIEAQIARAR